MRRGKVVPTVPFRINAQRLQAHSRTPAARRFSMELHRASHPRKQQRLRYPLGDSSCLRRNMSATSVTDSQPRLEKVFTTALLQQVRDFWFEDLSDEHLILPEQSQLKRWFLKDEEFDRACVAKFKSSLETIRRFDASAVKVLAAAKLSSPLDWLSVILLLDQIPRNFYRGDESAVVFRSFDPLVEEMALQAIEAGIPTQPSPVRYRLSYRMWFLLPLMHSENVKIHDLAIKQHEKIAADVDDLIREDRDLKGLDEDELKCRKVLLQQREASKEFLASNLDFEKRHQVIVARFGRYPHRNKALGRASTEEENECLENGGEIFGAA